jgi:hypothetical protein
MSTFIGDFSRFLAARRDLRLAAVMTPEGTFGADIWPIINETTHQ